MSATVDQSALSSSSPTKPKNILIRRVQLNDPSQMPSDLSTTPGGTLFSTTPGGTRIVYDRSFLLECRNSPLAKSPPMGLPAIPGVTCVALASGHTKNGVSPNQNQHHAGGSHVGHVPAYAHNTSPAAPASAHQKPAGAGDEQMFEIDM